MNPNRTPRKDILLFRIFPVLFALLLAAAPGAAEPQSPHSFHMHDDVHMTRTGDEPLGAVDFRVSCGEVRPAFDRALGLMHHMMYVEARAAFEKITQQDPKCAMAYWGVATTLFQPLWGTRPSADELQRGWTLIQEAKALGAATDRERHLVAATEGFFLHPDSPDFRVRIQRWADGMEAAYRAHPDDHDTAALYALSRLTLAQGAKDRGALLDEAEEVLRGIYEEVPDHPGAVHYTIHATDADGRAERALDIVRTYGEIAPQVPHALHMPSHIYVRLGEWEKVIDWNVRSAEAALNYPVAGAVSHHYPHATDYILYAYLQQGNDEEALAILEQTVAKERFQPSFISAFHLSAMPARYAVERRQWEAAAALEPRSPKNLPWDEALWAEGLTWLARGLGSVHTGDPVGAAEAHARLIDLRDRAQSAGDEQFAVYIEVDRRILAGWIAREEGDPEEAIRLIRSAGELESTTEKHPVTPGALLPPYEALGDLLMELGRPDEALAAYRASDEIWPRRYNTVLGAARAAAAAGDEGSAEDFYGELLEVAGESDRPGLSEAERYLHRGEVEAVPM